MEVREDAHKYFDSVVDAEEAVRKTIRWEQKMDQIHEDQMKNNR